jgi:hypothetical protein
MAYKHSNVLAHIDMITSKKKVEINVQLFVPTIEKIHERKKLKFIEGLPGSEPSRPAARGKAAAEVLPPSRRRI